MIYGPVGGSQNYAKNKNSTLQNFKSLSKMMIEDFWITQKLVFLIGF